MTRPGSDPNLDSQLRAYLTAWQEDQTSGNTIANLRIEERTSQDERRGGDRRETTPSSCGSTATARTGMLKQHLALSSDAEDTGTHQIEDLKRALASREKELEKHQEEGQWWRRKAVGWIVAAAAWVLTSVLAVAAWAATHPSPPREANPTFERGQQR